MAFKFLLELMFTGMLSAHGDAAVEKFLADLKRQAREGRIDDKFSAHLTDTLLEVGAVSGEVVEHFIDRVRDRRATLGRATSETLHELSD